MVKVKKFIRVLGVDDGFFVPGKKGSALLVGVVFRLDGCVEGILSTRVRVDALDATRKIVKMLLDSKFAEQVSFILLSGANVAGFNIIDVGRLSEKTGKPVIVVQRRKPDMRKIFLALKKFSDFEERKGLFEGLGEIHSFKNIFFQCHGVGAGEAEALLSKCIFHSNIPEPLRLAHLIASGTTMGQSTRPK